MAIDIDAGDAAQTAAGHRVRQLLIHGRHAGDVAGIDQAQARLRQGLQDLRRLEHA